MIKMNMAEVREYISGCSKESKIYFGADSERINIDGTWYVDYLLAVVIHIDSKHGGKMFGHVERELDFDRRLDRPKMRLMNEVYKIASLYLELADILEDRQVSIHLDLNPLPIHGSNCATSEAIGYIKGVCGIDPVVKPNSWVASNVADAVKRLAATRSTQITTNI